MKIEIKCHKCGAELSTAVDISNVLVDIILKVESCTNLDCHDCSSCDDAHQLKVQHISDERLPRPAPEKKLEDLKCTECKDIECLHYRVPYKKACAQFKT